MIRLIQITDTHIYAEAGDCFEGVDTRASFERVIKHLHRFNPAYDGLLLTGDLAMDGSREAYGYLRHMLAEKVPVLCLPGNHDQPRFLAESGLSTAAPAPLCYVIAEWHLILLDTQVDDCAHGEIEAAQIDWLNRSLGAAHDDYAAVFLHHHPASIRQPLDGCNGIGFAGCIVVGDRCASRRSPRCIWTRTPEPRLVPGARSGSRYAVDLCTIHAPGDALRCGCEGAGLPDHRSRRRGTGNEFGRARADAPCMTIHVSGSGVDPVWWIPQRLGRGGITMPKSHSPYWR